MSDSARPRPESPVLSAASDLDRAITDIGVTILALRACDEAGEPVPSRLRAHIRVMESEWFNVPTPDGAQRRKMLADNAGPQQGDNTVLGV